MAQVTEGQKYQMESISDIKKKIQAADEDLLPLILSEYRQDTREGVRRLVTAAERRMAAAEAEKKRIYDMCSFERKYEEEGYICGIDEVGRGPLAGPVMAGAVVLPAGCMIPYVNDSKQVSEKKREELYDVIMEKAVSVGIGSVSWERIDEINILQATYEAMRQAVSRLTVKPAVLLIDAVHIPDLPIKQVSIIKGDCKSMSIAAASIVAKVTRDRLMAEYAEKWPEYGFDKNKGYGSEGHIEALRKYGPCPIHRNSFIGNFTVQ
jgi:ribonuclease HII